jgi:hypothetical protein
LLVGSVLVLSVLATALVVDVAKVAATRATLTAAADAAALAAAPLTFASFGPDFRPQTAAATIAAENGARLESCLCPIDRSWNARTVVVVVAADAELRLLPDRSLTATAAAEFRPVDLGMSGSP